LEPGSPLQSKLIAALRDALAVGAPGARATLLETHISYVLLTGVYAYKIKKAIRLEFLDFTTLDARRFYCEEELRLNRRLAPALYLEVVAITGGMDEPRLGGPGPVLDYAVKMREFPQAALLGNVLDQGLLTAGHISRLAAIVARFHAQIAVAPPATSFGVPGGILRLALANFAEIRALGNDAADAAPDDLAPLEAWTRRQYAARHAQFAARRQSGFVRECHGDLHLGNMALIDGEPTIFDCIEFNDQMRWIDVMSEVAFIVMDLAYRRRHDYARRFLNAYLEETGDHGGLAVLRFYVVYRAMVRAKVAWLRAAQLPDGRARHEIQRDAGDHVHLATSSVCGTRPAVVITHGFAGCGKSTLSQALLERIDAIRIRTDVERKRLHGVGAHERRRGGIESALYSPDATRATYDHVLALARTVVASGFTVIVDGTFLRRWQRDRFRELARELRLPFVIVDIAARESTLRERIGQRERAASDASDAGIAVLEHQLRTHEPLASDESSDVVSYDGELPLAHAQGAGAWRGVVERVEAGSASQREGTRADSDLASKIAFLARPDSYPEGTRDVACVETHMSWVFLTDHHAYKLKKPVRTAYVDLSELAGRARNCDEEVRLNRRLSSNVYLGAVPLVANAAGELGFASGGDVVDWLVKMRRLPAERMLDRLIVTAAVQQPQLEALVNRLCDFYRRSPPAGTAPADYRRDFAAGIAEHRSELGRPVYALSSARVGQICARQLAFLSGTALLEARVRAGRIVEGHGDLRPEHICLEDDEPQIIDCLEFSRALRTLDPVDELGFLALECERLGAPDIGSRILDAYRRQSGDPAPDSLVHFYQSYRACARAVLAILHLQEAVHDPVKWRARAQVYLELADAHIARCA
jgi:aminoglycoside phosphotransferase family enzyme/predicted kinase